MTLLKVDIIILVNRKTFLGYLRKKTDFSILGKITWEIRRFTRISRSSLFNPSKSTHLNPYISILVNSHIPNSPFFKSALTKNSFYQNSRVEMCQFTRIVMTRQNVSSSGQQSPSRQKAMEIGSKSNGNWLCTRRNRLINLFPIKPKVVL